MFQEHRPSIVLMDVMMPGMNGYEVCRRLRDNPAFSNTKIVLVTARGALEDKVTGYEAGADDFIAKPFSEDNILETVAFFD